MYIYKTTNLITGKVYIGKSSKCFNIKYLGSGKILNRAIKKYGKSNFTVELIEECSSEEELNLREIYWIDFFISNSYNIALGGTGGDTLTNHPDREVIYNKISKTNSVRMIGHYVSDETRIKLSESHKKWHKSLTEEQKVAKNKKTSEGLKKFYQNNVHHSKGCTLSEERKNNLSEFHKKRGTKLKLFSEYSLEKQNEIRKNISNSLKGRVVSEETKDKIRKSLLGRPCSEEKKQKIKNTFKEKYGKSI
jgi:group I intron endonuclease